MVETARRAAPAATAGSDLDFLVFDGRRCKRVIFCALIRLVAYKTVSPSRENEKIEI
jgi:hypothetical protein